VLASRQYLIVCAAYKGEIIPAQPLNYLSPRIIQCPAMHVRHGTTANLGLPATDSPLKQICATLMHN
jgi:hypothetical protein